MRQPPFFAVTTYHPIKIIEFTNPRLPAYRQAGRRGASTKHYRVLTQNIYINFGLKPGFVLCPPPTACLPVGGKSGLSEFNNLNGVISSYFLQMKKHLPGKCFYLLTLKRLVFIYFLKKKQSAPVRKNGKQGADRFVFRMLESKMKKTRGPILTTA